MKRDMPINELCKDYPEEFQKYFNYVRKLEYEEDPDYNMIKNLFKDILKKSEFEFDYYYDWDIKLSINDCNCFNNDNFDEGKQTDDSVDINMKKKDKDKYDEDYSFDLPLDKIYYRKNNKKKKI